MVKSNVQHGSPVKMKVDRRRLFSGASWTFAGFAATLVLRFGTNVLLTHLLAPEIFGVVLIINTIKLGMELTCDVGFTQNIIHSRLGAQPDYYNTAWTMQVIRGVLLAVVCFALSWPISEFYGVPLLAVQITSLTFVLSGVMPLSQALAVKAMNLRVRNIFDIVVELISLAMLLLFAYLYPTIWALVVAHVVGAAIRCGASFLLPSPKHRLTLVWEHAADIFHFGKWIFLASVVYFASSYADRLFFGRVAPFAVLGVYGIARSLAELPTILAGRLSHFVVLPIISGGTGPREELRAQLSRLRLLAMLGGAVSLAIVAAFGDVIVGLVYDDRYIEASWMLPLLLLGVWGGVVCTVGETVLMGLGRPSYSSYANTIKLMWLVVALPISYASGGMLGGILAFAVSDFVRYVPVLVGQKRERFSFARQDLVSTAVMFGTFGLCLLVRWWLGFGTTFDTLNWP